MTAAAGAVQPQARRRVADPWACIRHCRRVTVGRGERVGAGLAKLVLLVIASYADPDGTNANPSMALIASDAGIDERTARAAVRHLERSALLRVQVGGDPTGRTNGYTVVMPRLQLVPAGTPPPGQDAPRVGASCPPTYPVPPSPPVVPPSPDGQPVDDDESDALRAAHFPRPARRPGCTRHHRARAGCRDCRPTDGPAYVRYVQPPPVPPASTEAREAAKAALRAAQTRKRADKGGGRRPPSGGAT